MKPLLLFLVFFSEWFTAPFSVANDNTFQSEQSELNGTWSGSWVPEGGTRDSMTIEFSQDKSGKLTGRFVTPVAMEFRNATFNPKTRMLLLEAQDLKTGKEYRLNGTIEQTEIRGTLVAGNDNGKVHLIKWTYVPRLREY